MKTLGVEHAPYEIEHAAGVLRGPENLYRDNTKDVVNRINNLLPASKGDVQASAQATDAKLEAQLEEYTNKTTAVINGLVGVVNSMTPVGS